MTKFHIKTWGCQMNTYDSDRIASIFTKTGLVPAKNMSEADIIVLNTCSVRQRAEDKVLGLGPQMQSLREKNPSLKVVMTGCMAQRVGRGECKGKDTKYTKRLKMNMPWVDIFVNEGDMKSVEALAENLGSFGKSKINTSQSKIVNYLPISSGCNNFCTYCIVPFTRGEEKNRSYKSIEQELKRDVESGSRLIILLGQNVNSWSGKIGNYPAGFPKLLDELAQGGDFWLSFITSHPKDFSDDLIDVISRNKKISRSIYLPVQSGSNEILKRMNRGYSVEHYKELISKIWNKIPDARISTDIIVGFPGETESDFQQSLELLKWGNFSNAYISEYSPRLGTASARLKDDVSRIEKKKRKEALEEVMRTQIIEQNEKMIGKTIRVLVVTKSLAKTFDLRECRILNPDDSNLGEFMMYKVEGCSVSGFSGQIVI